LALLALSLRTVDWGRLAGDLGAAHLGWVALGVGSVILGLALKIWRWQILLRGFDLQLGMRTISESFLAGQATDILLPVRGGVVVRMGMAAEGQPARLPRLALTIGLEKLLDLLALTGAALLVAAYLPPEVDSRIRGWLLPLSGMALVLLMVALAWGPRIWSRVRRMLHTGSHAGIERILDAIGELVESSLWLRDGRRALAPLGITLLIWATMWSTNLLVLRSIDLRLGTAAGGLILVTLMLGLLPALMPGNIGPFYFLAQFALLPFGVEAQSAVVFAILLHAVVTLPPLIGAGLFLASGSKTRRREAVPPAQGALAQPFEGES
jgi:hypothetical protein